MKTTITTTVPLAAAAWLLLCAPTTPAADPQTAPDDSWISVSGKVTDVTPTTFDLKYESATITVEFDDWDSDADAYKLVTGDRVTVTGKIDDDLFERRTIEGSSVYVDSINTYYYASAADEENFVAVTPPVDGSPAVLQGTVTAITKDDEYQLMAGSTLITVETEEMPYNPLDDEGYQQIDVGDRVSIIGEFDKDFLEGYDLVAKAIVSLSNNR